MNCYQFTVVGAGPAAICAIANLLAHLAPGGEILWVDPAFQVGDFGSCLSAGSSVPGNTTVASYQRVNHAIYKMFPSCRPAKNKVFELDTLEPDVTCKLKIAAAPLLHISHGLRQLVQNIEGRVTQIHSTLSGFDLSVTTNNNKTINVRSKKVILATGASPKSFISKQNNIHWIEPNIAFIESALSTYLKYHSIKAVTVIGSSHSAALAVMHLLRTGVSVKQMMNKAYRYAVSAIASDGKPYTQFDNTGLKGEVAAFTKQLWEELATGKSEYQHQFSYHIETDKTQLSACIEAQLTQAPHAIATIGYVATPTLTINGQALSHFSHHALTTAFENIPGLFGIGIAFPQQVQAISGEIEMAVGVGKFWATTSSPAVWKAWAL